MITIYCIINKLNGNIYIGKSKNHLSRWRKHKNVALFFMKDKRNIKGVCVIHRAMAKHGVDNFIFDIIDVAKTQEESCILEKYWIRLLKQAGVTLYNSTSGGDGAYELLGEDRANTKLKNGQVLEIKYFLMHGRVQNEIAKVFNTNRSSILHIHLNNTWKHINLSEEDIMFFNMKHNAFGNDLVKIFEKERFDVYSKPKLGSVPHNKGKKSSIEIRTKLGGENCHFAILTEEDIPKIRKLLSEGLKEKDIAKKFNVARQSINRIKLKRTWKFV